MHGLTLGHMIRIVNLTASGQRDAARQAEMTVRPNVVYARLFCHWDISLYPKRACRPISHFW